MIAFFSESKAITIHINNFNEQYLDIAALIVIWLVMFIGIFFMIKLLREKAPSRQSVFNFEKVPSINKNNILYGISFDKDKSGFIGYISKSSKNEDIDYDDNN
jgi:hypothetical protein